MTALGKTAEILRGLGGALGCSCPSDPRRVTPPPAGGGRFLRYRVMMQVPVRQYPLTAGWMLSPDLRPSGVKY